MRLPSVLAVAVVLACAVSLSPGPAVAAKPPNPHDPCANSAGHDICGTTFSGSYETYRYGVRWFGDYRDAIPGAARSFCIDLNYWYPSPRYGYRLEPSTTLTNRDGVTVPRVREEKLAYAIATFGRTNDPTQDEAVMLYVHTLMGDARPGEVDPSILGAGVVSRFNRISSASSAYHGPYRIVARMPRNVVVGGSAVATVRVVSASGFAVPNIRLRLVATGARGVPGSIVTDGSGIGQVSFSPSGALAGVRVAVTALGLASTLPAVYQPTAGASSANGQRLAVPTFQTLSATFGSSLEKVQLRVGSVAEPSAIAVGQASSDRFTVAGATPDWHGTVSVTAYGPFATVGAIRCVAATSVWKGSIQAGSEGRFTVGPVFFSKPGWYAYREVVPGDPGNTGVSSNCSDPFERVQVQVQPILHTVVSAPTLAPGASLSDTISASGLDGQAASVQAMLYGPFASAAAINCDVPIWTGTVQATSGPAETQPFMITVPGYYAYREQIMAQGFVRATTSTCGEASETAIVTSTPVVDTEASTQLMAPGEPLSDAMSLSGLGTLAVTVDAELWGPFATKSAINCTGTPLWSANIVAAGAGEYRTPPVVVQRVGYYTFRESIVASPAVEAVAGACGAATETTLVEAHPTVATVVQSPIVRPGSGVADLIRVTGLGQTKARVMVQLFGPFSTREGTQCTGVASWQETLTVNGDGTFRSPAVRLAKAGFYVFHERLIGSPLITGVTTPCAQTSETALGAPMIITGRGDVTEQVLVAADGPAPTSLQIPSLGIDAPVSSIGIDLATGDLGVSPDIHKLGWWRDGAAPGARSGAVLIAGHVDSATAGAGALFPLKNARPGALVQVTMSNGQTRSYRVLSVHLYLKRDLPLDVYSQTGPPRLVIVTCGGPFDTATRHYDDNVILTAVPT